VLEITPITFKEANEFIKKHHRHHNPPKFHKYSIGVSDGEEVRGVVMVNRPVSRVLDNGWTLEVSRLCTDGVRNGCSKLYQAAWRVCKNLGYRRLITYTLPAEGGASLRAAGWRLLGEAGGGSWNTKSRPRVDTHPLQKKFLWEAPQ